MLLFESSGNGSSAADHVGNGIAELSDRCKTQKFYSYINMSNQIIHFMLKRNVMFLSSAQS